MDRLLKILALAALLGLVAPVQAYHFPWDQGHDTTDWNDPPPPGPCEGGECKEDECDENTKKSPVYIQTGQFNWIDTDITLPGRFTLGITRSYQSSDPRDGLFGNGWSFEHDKMLLRVRDTSSGTERFRLMMRLPNGKRYAFEENTDGTFVRPCGIFRSVQKQPDDTLRLTSASGAYEQYAYGRLTERTDRSGNRIYYRYDATGNMIRVEDNAGRHLDFVYLANGRVGTVADHAGRTWRYDYDSDGNLIAVTDPLGGVRHYQYSAYRPPGDGHTYYLLTRITDESGVVLTNVTYSGGKVTSYTDGTNTWSYSYDTTNRVTRKTNSLGKTWTFRYNADGLSVEDTDPLGNKVTVTRDVDGLATRTIDPAGYAWLNEFDAQGRRLSYTNPPGATTRWEYQGTNPSPVKSVSPIGRNTLVTYDVNNRPLTMTDPAGAVTRLEWNEKGDLVTTTDALGNQSHTTHNSLGLSEQITDPLGRVTLLSYDVVGRLTAVSNPAGETRRMAYDPLGRLISTTNPAGQTVSYEYDPAGRLLTLTDPKGQSWRNTYDSYGRLVSETSPDGRTTTLTYNTDNSVQTETRPDGGTVTYAYDAAGRLTAKQVGGYTTTYTYDARGLMIGAQNSAATITRTYDTAGRLLTETVNGRTVQNTYNAEGERIQLTAADRTLDYTRDARGLVTQVTAQGTHQLSYDTLGRLSGITHPNGITTSDSYDAAGQLAGLQHGGVMSLTYSHDAAGRINRKSGNGDDWRYQYDLAERLVLATGLVNSQSYQYDELGNRLDQSGVYDAANRIQEDLTYSYVFDTRGNLTQKTEKSTNNRHVYAYSGDNRLVRFERYAAGASTPDMVATYAYDPFGRRVQKDVNGSITSYQWDGENLLAEYDASGNVTYRYFYADGHAPLQVEDSNGSYQVHTDDLEAPSYLTDNSGQIVWRANYEPYGKATVDTDSDGNGIAIVFNFRFAGQYADSETGYYYNYYRDYDPALGAYIESDPLGLAGGINTYRYVAGNPISNRDPFGLQDNTSPWELGVEWLTGTGPRHHDFSDGDPFAETLRNHQHIRELVQDVCNGKRPPQGRNDYSVGGFKGVPLYFRDYSTLLTGGATGNLAVTYLGSYNLNYSSSNGVMTITVNNASTIASATHPPVIGYTDWWNRNVGVPLNQQLQTGPMSKTTQTITLHENVSGCNCQ